MREVCKSQKISRFANSSNKNSKNKFFGTFNFFKVEVFENSNGENELFKFLMRKKFVIILFIISLIILLLSIGGFFLKSKPIESIRLYASVNVTDSAGFDLNSSALSFGNIVLGGSSIRNVIFENKHDFPVIAAISVEGDIKELLNYESPVIVESRETKRIPFSVVSSLSSERRVYSGSVIFKVFRQQ